MEKQLEKSLTDIGNYIKDNLVNGDYEFVSADIHTAKILIQEHKFLIWITNTQPDHLGFYSSTPGDYILLQYLKLTQEEKEQAWKHLKPQVKEYFDNYLINEKEKELEEIKKQNKKI